ncbi:MAG: Lipoprotein signal peptidase (Prolipoprotein signalpeptidase) [uncultured bacterium]|nr:MAG: Lipoprotein signal peptidase (Prolipoprotein signalpeptidase) [uncultured bacterium]
MPEAPIQKSVWLYGAPLLSVLVFMVDRLVKVYFYTRPELTINVIPQWLWLHLHLNTQMALSLPLFPILYYSLTTIVCVALIGQLVRMFQQRKAIEYTLILVILAGALSNLLDRIYYGGVVDYITVAIGSVFNIADSVIVLAVGIWIVRLFYYDHHKKVSAPR